MQSFNTTESTFKKQPKVHYFTTCGVLVTFQSSSISTYSDLMAP